MMHHDRPTIRSVLRLLVSQLYCRELWPRLMQHLLLATQHDYLTK